MLNISSAEWTEAPDVGTRIFPACVADDVTSTLFAIGGKVDNVPTDKIETLDIANLDSLHNVSWVELDARFAADLWYGMAVLYGDDILVLGAYTCCEGGPEDDMVPMQIIVRFPPHAISATTIGFEQPRYRVPIMRVDAKIYAVGGKDPYSNTLDTWESLYVCV